MIKYTVVNGTSYNVKTPVGVVKVLEMERTSGGRITIDLGDTKTGRSWEEHYDISGYVGRSMGPQKVPILLYNSRSLGGGEILTSNIVAIYISRGKKLLYSHPTYKTTKKY